MALSISPCLPLREWSRESNMMGLIRYWDVVWENQNILVECGISIMLLGCSGFYSYGIFEHQEGCPDDNIYQGRIIFKLDERLTFRGIHYIWKMPLIKEPISHAHGGRHPSFTSSSCWR